MINMEMLCLLMMAALSYFIGNISPATVVARLHGIDIRKEGSGNPGTTNVLRTLGKTAAAGTLLIDILKGFIPAFFSGIIMSAVFGEGRTDYIIPQIAVMLCGGCALLGHMWPVCFKFQGGKGIATGFGVTMAMDWKVGITALIIALLGAFLSKRMSVGSIAAAISFPIATYIFVVSGDAGSLGIEHVWASVLAVLIIWKHKGNIERLMKGEEPPLKFLTKGGNGS